MPVSKSRKKKKDNRPIPPVAVSQKNKRTARWVIPACFAMWIGGTLTIIVNYMGLFGGEANNMFLFVGLGMIASGFIISTRIY